VHAPSRPTQTAARVREPSVLTRSLGVLAIILANVAVLLAAVKIYDIYLVASRPVAVADAGFDHLTMRMMEYYPFDGFHLQANMHETGRPYWTNAYETNDLRTGEYGYFIDFQLENPPAKPADEIRIILTGGSGAQGWGGQTNADMFYQLLPARLTRDLAAEGRACKVRVINLAMGSANAYQNFITLNRWGHRLAPDAILSFAQFNEIYNAYWLKSDAPYGAAQAGAVQKVFRNASSPPWLKRMAEYFPGIVKHTTFGSVVRFYYLGDYVREWDEAYGAATWGLADVKDPAELHRRYSEIVTKAERTETIKRISTPVYIHALESISRDFPGTPVFSVFQPSWGTPLGIHEMFDEITGTLERDHYTNVKFYNLFDIWEKNDWFLDKVVDGVKLENSFVDQVHLSNRGHRLATDYLAQYLLPFARERCTQLSRKTE